jgi:hypothetical protein
MDDILDKHLIDAQSLTWFKLSLGIIEEDRNVFFQFVAAWMAFNALYASRIQHKHGDLEKVLEFSNVEKVSECHLRLITSNSNYISAVGTLMSKGIFDPVKREKRRISDTRKLNEVLRCIYQVRCNLFHGGKSPEDMRDRKIIESSLLIISELLQEIYLIYRISDKRIQ